MSIKGLFPIDKWELNSGSILAGLPAKDLETLQSHISEKIYDKGEIIFREGSVPGGIFYIRRGKVKKYKADKAGREQIIYVANAGELIGYHALLADERYFDTAAALEETLVSFIPKEDFQLCLDNSEVLSRRLLKSLSHEFSVFTNSIAMFGQRSVRERFAMQLVIMREKYKQNFQPGMPVEIKMSRDDLARLVGTARENIIRILGEFKADGILETKGRSIIITDINKLVKLTNTD